MQKIASLTIIMACLAVSIGLIAIVPLRPVSAQIKGNVERFSDQEICTAIYFAEGGVKTKYPYGIKGGQCGQKNDCKRRCEKIIGIERQRFERIAYPGPSTYIQILQSRYCPCGSGANAQGCEQWQANVMFFLNHPRSL